MQKFIYLCKVEVFMQKLIYICNNLPLKCILNFGMQYSILLWKKSLVKYYMKLKCIYFWKIIWFLKKKTLFFSEYTKYKYKQFWYSSNLS